MVQAIPCRIFSLGIFRLAVYWCNHFNAKNEERLSSTDSKSSQCDSDHKQSFLYSWDCWEMSLIWPQSSKKRKSACREILY
jgi:hypothetical protein